MTTQITSLEEYHREYAKSIENPSAFWKKEAETFHWFKPFNEVLKWNFEEPSVKWFLNGKTNITYNALDRHIKDRGDKTAIL